MFVCGVYLGVQISPKVEGKEGVGMKKLYDLWARMLIFMSRGGRYVSLLNTFMLSKVFWETFDNKVVAIVLLIIGVLSLLTLTSFDYRHVFGREQGVSWRKNHSFIDIKEQLDRIEKRLEVIENGQRQ